MSLFSSAFPRLVVAVAIATGCAVAGCAATSEVEDEPTAEGEDDLTGATNPMGLRLVYDEPSHHLRATVRKRLRAGESLKLAVRRGRLSGNAQPAAIDCAQLPHAPPLPRPEGTTKIVYDGPEIEPSLLANVYQEQWIMRAVAPPLLDRLAREGADSIVEACIVKDEAPRVTLKTSIECAWDERDPNAAESSLAHRSCPVAPSTTPNGQGQQ